MKKFLSLLFALSLCFSFSLTSAGCGNLLKNENNSDSSNSVCSHIWSYPECETPQTCSLCGEISGEAYGHVTVNGACQRCGKTLNLWSISNTFNPLTGSFGNKYLTTQASGTFLTSANLLSKLTVSVRVDANSISFTLYEQGSFLVISTTDSTCDISIRDTEKNIHNLSGTMNANSVTINVDSTDIPTILTALKKPGTVRFYLAISSKPSNFYEFSLETNNFAELYSEIE